MQAPQHGSAENRSGVEVKETNSVLKSTSRKAHAKSFVMTAVPDVETQPAEVVFGCDLLLLNRLSYGYPKNNHLTYSGKNNVVNLL